MTVKDCTTCVYFNVLFGYKAVCDFWLVGFDMRGGYKPCEEYKERENENNF